MVVWCLIQLGTTNILILSPLSGLFVFQLVIKMAARLSVHFSCDTDIKVF